MGVILTKNTCALKVFLIVGVTAISHASSAFSSAQVSRPSITNDSRVSKNKNKLTPHQKETFADLELELFKLHEIELKNAIAKSPKKKKALTADFKKKYEERIQRLMEAYIKGQLEIKMNWIEPGLSNGIPTGYGSGWGSITAFASFTPRSRTGAMDGAVGFGIGLGNSEKWVSVAVGVLAEGLYPDNLVKKNIKDYFKFSLDNGGIGLHVTRDFPNALSLSIGQAHVFSWGLSKQIRDTYKKARYVVVSKSIYRGGASPWLSRFTGTLGMGNKGFLPIDQYMARSKAYKPFGGLNVRLHNPISMSLETQGGEMNIGYNLAPFRETPVLIQVNFNNLLRAADNNREIYISGSYSLQF